MNKISIIGLGFVGLPLACILAGLNKKKLKIVGIDKKFINKKIQKISFNDICFKRPGTKILF